MSQQKDMRYITEYNHDWPIRFAQITAYLTIFLPDSCTVHHIGSTSVPGLPAKDTIDMDIEYVHGNLKTIIINLKKAGYRHLGDLGIPGREAFKPIPNSNAASLPDHHLYACEAGAYELLKHLAYRDYLKANPDRSEWLGKKKVLADASANSRDEYIEKKTYYYKLVTKESMEWAGNAFKPLG